MDQVRTHAPLVDPGTVPRRTRVIGADPALPWTFMPSFDLSGIRGLDYDFLPGASHLLQLERPAECAALLRGFLESEGLRQTRRVPAGMPAPPPEKPRGRGVLRAGVVP